MLDGSETETQLAKAFRSLLEGAIKERLREHRRSLSGRTGTAKDRLKDLAVWRLFEHCGGNWIKANRIAQKHQSQAFHGARAGIEKDSPKKEEAPLYSEKSGFLDAIERARKHLAERMPWEFFAEARAAELGELRAQAQRAYEQLPSGWGRLGK